MKILFYTILFILFYFNGIAQTIPNSMFDVSYSNNYLFLNNESKTNYSNGDIVVKLKNDFEVNAMVIFLRNSKSKHHKLYGGLGLNFSEYTVQRNIFKEQSYFGHFPMIYSYTPNKLEYNIQLFRINLQLCHYTFYKRVILFQKIGLGYSVFLKKSNLAAYYQEQYGNSTPMQDAGYITADNPNGWYWQNNYTYTDKNDLDIYKNGVSAFYRFGMGIRIKQFTPFAAFEFSNVTSKFWSPYVKFQLGVNYSILPH